MEIRIRATGAVMTESEFRSYQKTNGGPTWNQTTEEVLEALGADVVFEGPQAQPTRYQVAFRDGVEQVNGKWYTKYSVRDMEQEAKDALDAQQATSVRQQRDAKLKETDWIVIKAMETGTPVPANIAAERQFLRDIPAQAGFPWDVQWSSQPE